MMTNKWFAVDGLKASVEHWGSGVMVTVHDEEKYAYRIVEHGEGERVGWITAIMRAYDDCAKTLKPAP